MARIDITNKIERLKVFEEQLGVTLESLSAFFLEYMSGDEKVFVLVTCGELQATNGTKLKRNIDLLFEVHDTFGNIVKTTNLNFWQKIFFGMESFKIETWGLPISDISKIRIYPKEEKTYGRN